jgi:hypothetical protein
MFTGCCFALVSQVVHLQLVKDAVLADGLLGTGGLRLQDDIQ